MNKDVPFNLNLMQWNTKIPVDALARLKELHALAGEPQGSRISDVLAACILLVDADALEAELRRMREVEDATPKVIKDLVRNMGKMTDEERETAMRILSSQGG